MSQPMDDEAAELRERVRRAFPAGKPPVKIAGMYFASSEVALAESLMKGKRWDEIPPEDLHRVGAQCLPLLSERAQIYYLPALLIRVLDYQDGEDTAFVMMAAIHLERLARTPKDRRPKGVTDEQWRLLDETYRYVMKHHSFSFDYKGMD